jgi:hypothetical protein
MRLRVLVYVPVAVLATTITLAAPASAAPDPTDAFYLTPGQLSGAVVTTTDVETIGGVTVTQVLTAHYDTRGRETLETAVIQDASDIVTGRRESSWEYDSKGRLYREIVVSDGDGDGLESPQTVVTSTTFDKSSYVIAKVRTVDEDSDGTIDETSSFSFSNDHRGRVLTTIYQDSSGTQTTLVTYDGRGHVVRAEVVTTSPTNVLESSEISTYDYNSQGRLVTQSDSRYDGAGTLTNGSSQVSTYDSRGNVVAITLTVDWDGDGVTDARQDYVFEYDSSSRLVRTTILGYHGTSTTPESRFEARLAYDSKGRLISYEGEFDADDDGAIDSRERETTTYDGQGRRLRVVTEQDNDADGSADYTFTTDYTYDSKGRLASVLSVSSSTSGPGTTMSIHYSYPSKTTVVFTMEFDADGNGVFDQTYVQTRTVA